MKQIRWLFLTLLLLSCEEDSKAVKENQTVVETITRRHDDVTYLIERPKSVEPEPYPWEKGRVANLPFITKEFFRCKGCYSNPIKIVEKNGEMTRLSDCRGTQKHGLPLRNGKEFIYPILINLLNEIQQETGRRVVITSGHRCPEHNTYVDPSRQNLFSKHQFGAEVSFYVQGMEYSPEKIIEIIKHYYQKSDELSNEFSSFKRYAGTDTNVSIQPWFNKEIFIKLFQKHEGRHFDNRHPYPYIDIQVRYDRELDERVVYTWKQAHMQHLRR